MYYHRSGCALHSIHHPFSARFDCTRELTFVHAKTIRTPTNYHVTGLDEALLKTWASDEKTANDVFKLLHLDKNGGKLFESPTFDMWVSYVTKLDKMNPDKLMLSVLKTRYNDESLTNMLITAQKVPRTKAFAASLQEQLWISQDKTADDIFKLLKLDQEGGNLFSSGEFGTWVSYVTRLNKLDDRPDEFTVFSDLQKRFEDLELAKMFAAELQRSDANKNLIGSLQALQFKGWLADGLDPNKLDRMLSHGGFDIRSTGVYIRYVDFYRAN